MLNLNEFSQTLQRKKCLPTQLILKQRSKPPSLWKLALKLQPPNHSSPFCSALFSSRKVVARICFCSCQRMPLKEQHAWPKGHQVTIWEKEQCVTRLECAGNNQLERLYWKTFGVGGSVSSFFTASQVEPRNSKLCSNIIYSFIHSFIPLNLDCLPYSENTEHSSAKSGEWWPKE